MKIITPLRIRSHEIRNRIAMTAMHLQYTPEGTVTEQLIEFYRRRARGGVGLIIVGGCIVSPYGGSTMMISIKKESDVPGLTKLASAMNEEGATSCAQLYHGGAYVHSFFLNGERALSASAVRSGFTHEVPKEMTAEEIAREIGCYAEAAVRAKRAGFHMVEILACGGYLINQFLSPVTNTRTDEYGGSLDRRMKFGLEVVAAVRKAVGDRYLVGMRVAGNDFVKGGNTNRESVRFCREVEKLGIDLINVTGGWHETRVPQITTFVPRGAYAYLAKNIKQAVGVPVIACNRITDPDDAEETVVNGIADMVGIARGHIADPDWVNKASRGKSDEIQHCIGCAQGCFEHIFQLKPVGCLVNPMAGNEYRIKAAVKSVKSKKVLVIGGGVAGMEAALVADERGHDVTIAEAGDRLGGQFLLAAATRQRKDLGTAVKDLVRRISGTGIRVMLNTKVDRGWIQGFNPDSIVVATGAKPVTPGIRGIERPNVHQGWDVLKKPVELGKDVVIVGGGAVGVEIALHIAEIGTIDGETARFLIENDAEDFTTIRELFLRGMKNVTLIEMIPGMGRDIGKANRWVFMQDLERRGIRQMVSTTVREITDRGVWVEHGDGREEVIPADSVILAVGSRPERGLYEEIRDMGYDIRIAGDANRVGKAYDAVHDGFEAGLSL